MATQRKMVMLVSCVLCSIADPEKVVLAEDVIWCGHSDPNYFLWHFNHSLLLCTLHSHRNAVCSNTVNRAVIKGSLQASCFFYQYSLKVRMLFRLEQRNWWSTECWFPKNLLLETVLSADELHLYAVSLPLKMSPIALVLSANVMVVWVTIQSGVTVFKTVGWAYSLVARQCWGTD